MTPRPSKAGFALPFALCLAAITAMLVGSLLGYVTYSLRTARGHLDRTVCRLAAQSGIEQAKALVFLGFKKNSFKGRNLVGMESTGSGDFAWFPASSSFSRSIGTRNPVTFPDWIEINGCRVYVRIVKVYKPNNYCAEVTLAAKAVLPAAGVKANAEASTCLLEKIRFAQGRSKVFDNAYFVNNYGWFQGTGCVANGDVRANGDIYLDSGCRVNGKVYAVQNEDLDVDGVIQNYGKMDTRSSYKSTTYGTSNRARPLDVDGGYFAPSSSPTTSVLKDRCYNQARMESLYPGQDDFRVPMPYISDLDDYVAWARELHDDDSSLATIKQGGRTIATVKYDGPGPSGLSEVPEYDSNGRAVKDANGDPVTTRPADYGALVLVGTQTNPIEINGPVVVPNDVIIKGYVTGQGTIYSGRNIHVVGSIKYVNPPAWANKAVPSDSSNASKDLVGFMAKGNIVMGDYSQSSWHSGIDTYLSQEPYVQKYACDASDADIGYPATFQGSYVSKEYVADGGTPRPNSSGGTYTDGYFAKLEEATVNLGTYHTVTTTTYDRWGRPRTTTKQVEDTAVVTRNSYNRRYYESTCKSTEVSSRCETISQLDGVFYNNHGIFGKLGSCTVNGSLVCRNEGLQYSSYLYLNWDYRLYSGSAETVDNDRVGLAKSSGLPPTTLAWQEVPVALFDAAEGTLGSQQ